MHIPSSRGCQSDDSSVIAFNDDKFTDRVLRIEILGNGFETERSSDDRNQTAEQQEITISKVLRVKKLGVSSVILAAKSPFFLKMFSNGMKESKQQQVTLKIHVHEEAAFMNLLNYVYTNTLPKGTASALLELLIIADKFEVPSCMRCCIESFCSLPTTCELALFFLHESPRISNPKIFQPFIDSAKEFFAKTLKTLDEFPEEIGNVDQAVIETVLFRDDLQMRSEDTAYDFLMKWVTTHFSDLEEKRKFLNSSLCKLIRFPYMSPSKLREFLRCNLVDEELTCKVIFESAFYKLEILNRERGHQKAELRSSKDLLYVKRRYANHTVSVIAFDIPFKQSIIYLELKKEECQNLEHGPIWSETFHVGDQEFYLAIERKVDKDNSPCFGLHLHRQQSQGTMRDVVYEFAVRKKTDKKFDVKGSQTCTFYGWGNSTGFDNLLGVKWDALMAENSEFFIDGNMYLRADILVK